MEKIEYPKWLYHAEKAPQIVKSEADAKALGSDWVETPADVKKAEAPKVSKKTKEGSKA